MRAKLCKKSKVGIFHLAVFLMSSAMLPGGLAEEGSDPKVESAAKEEEKWSVSEPPGEWEEISIDTRQTTWSEVDVSPDGETIIFDMLGDIYRVSIRGGDAEALTDGIEWNFQPRFSPDGKRIAFISDRSGGDNIWVMNADGSDPVAVSSEKENLVHTPSWSHDGEYLVGMKGFTGTRSIPGGEIWLFHRSGGNGLQVIERSHGPQSQKNIAEPTFSHDDRHIYYSQDTTAGSRWAYNKDATGQIFVIKRIERSTGKIEVVVDGPGGAVRPTPSRNGKYLAFIKRIPPLNSAIYIKDLESGKEWALYDGLDRDLQETNGSQGNATNIAWLPGDTGLVFWAGGTFHKVDLETREVSHIPVRVKVKKKIQKALRFKVDVSPDRFHTKMVRWAQYSPDRKSVLFQALGHIYIRDQQSGAHRRLTKASNRYEYYPSFSLDGRKVVFVTWNDDDLGSVRVLDLNSGRETRITPQPGHYIEAKFSKDASLVTYRKIAGGYLLSPIWSQEPGIYVTTADGTGTPKRISNTGFGPHFNPEGDRIYYSKTVDTTKLALESVDLEGKEVRKHLKGSSVTEYAVSPDGRWVAFTEKYNAFVAPFPATGKSVDVSASMKSLPVKQVSKRSGEFLTWSAKSDALRWTHGATLYERDLRDAFAFLEGAPEELPEPVEEGVDVGFDVDADRPQQSIALVGARIVTMRDAGLWKAKRKQEVIEDGVVLVEGNRITKVGPRSRVKVPQDAFVLDVTGKTIVPGLVDVHAHGGMSRSEIIPQQNWMQYSNLAFGVTTIHDPSNDTSSIFAAAEMQRAGMIVGPRIFSTGTILYGANAPAYRAEINSYEDALFHVRRLKDVGAISVKSYQQPRRDQRQQVIAAGRELGIMVVPEGGAKFQHNMTEIVDGHTGIEHSIPLMRAYEDVLQFWSQSETAYTPTYVVAYGGLSGENYWYDRTDVWRNERLMRYSPRFMIEPRSIRRSKAPDSHYNHIRVAEFSKELSDRGVSVQIGAHGQREGLAAHWEMWMMEQGGFTPWEALRNATIQGAWYVGLDHELGSIEKGKLADLFVIDGNPLEDLRRSEYVLYTMINGRLYEAKTMNQIGKTEVERKAFFFEKEGGDTIHPSTARWLKELEAKHGWRH